MSAEVKYCIECSKKNLTHDFQDTQYGKFFRVFNVNEKTGTRGCTICGAGRKSKK